MRTIITVIGKDTVGRFLQNLVLSAMRSALRSRLRRKKYSI